MSSIDRFEENLKFKTKETFGYLLRFAMNPIQEIKALPHWGYKHLFLVHLILSIASGVLAGLVTLNYLNVLFGIFLLPVISIVMILILTAFFYYYFQVFERRTVPMQSLLTLIIFANWPFFIFQIGSHYLPPLTLLGFAFTGLLLVVGLTKNFQLEKKKSIRLVLILFSVIFLVWLWNQIDLRRMDRM